jgi:ABC-2 type transport system ATP-binding protein
MCQRLGIAIAIMKNAKVVLLDEPTSGLDPEGGREFIEILRSLKEENKAILMTSHDIFRSRQIADRVGIMNRGSIIQIIPRDDFEKANLEELYFKYVEAEEVAVSSEM